MVSKPEINLKKRNKRIRRWAIYTMVYAIFYGILVGTLTHYFEGVSLGIGLYMDIPSVFTIIGVGGWVLMTFLLFKGKGFSLGGS